MGCRVDKVPGFAAHRTCAGAASPAAQSATETTRNPIFPPPGHDMLTGEDAETLT